MSVALARFVHFRNKGVPASRVKKTIYQAYSSLRK